jgi:UDP-N-acetylglucosamine 2-epimerase (non-hydrolysing)
MKILLIFGTRPEAIKLAPILRVTKEQEDIEMIVCVSAQHRQLLDQVLNVFAIEPDYDLNIMVPDQSLFHITGSILEKIGPLLRKERPDVVIVQGDAQTAFVGALSAYYEQIPVAHVEAGLRTNDKYSPFPEEINRRLIDHIADLLFAPTEHALNNLLTEGIPSEQIFIVGNTEIDSLYFIRDHVQPAQRFTFSERVILVTAHRRESFSGGIASICQGLREIVRRNQDVRVVYSVHPNPNVQREVRGSLAEIERITLLDPLDYASFVHLMADSYLILTDSGGIQEAGPALDVPVLVLRNKTERMEGINTGAAKLIGTDPERIITETENLLNNRREYTAMTEADNPYGDGTAAEKIIEILQAKVH